MRGPICWTSGNYFTRVGSMDVADHLLFDIERAARRLVQFPMMGRPRDELGPGLRSVLIHPHVMFYRRSDDAIGIARVLHQRRDLPAAFASESGESGDP